jgi:hypothetical protein
MSGLPVCLRVCMGRRNSRVRATRVCTVPDQMLALVYQRHSNRLRRIAIPFRRDTMLRKGALLQVDAPQ